MSVNYYNRIELKNATEQSFSVSNTLEKWGDKLIGGKTGLDATNGLPKLYTIDLETHGITQADFPQMSLGIVDKIKMAVGICLKHIAAFFSSDIKNKYLLVGTNNDTQAEKLFGEVKAKHTAQKTVSKKEGCTEEELCGVLCCLFCFKCLSDSANHPYTGFYGTRSRFRSTPVLIGGHTPYVAPSRGFGLGFGPSRGVVAAPIAPSRGFGFGGGGGREIPGQGRFWR